jgi:hypothetical protein
MPGRACRGATRDWSGGPKRLNKVDRQRTDAEDQLTPVSISNPVVSACAHARTDLRIVHPRLSGAVEQQAPRDAFSAFVRLVDSHAHYKSMCRFIGPLPFADLKDRAAFFAVSLTVSGSWHRGA